MIAHLWLKLTTRGSKDRLNQASHGFPAPVSQALCAPTGFFAISVSALAVAAAAHQGVDITYIHSHFLQLTAAAFLVSVLLSVYLYVHSQYAASEQLALGGSSGKGAGAAE